MDKIDIKSLNIKELENLIEKLGDKKFRSKQIFDWLHVKLVDQIDEMTNLSKNLRQQLRENCQVTSLKILRKQENKAKDTIKYLFELHDKRVIESVFMRYKHGNSVCISSQVGCKMGCKFCASTIGGLERNLTPGEMLDQIYQIQKDLGERVTNVVVMGTGEPLDNYDNLIRFINLLTDENGLNISGRNVTVSTCGLVDKIYKLADEKLQITLAISLHAPNDELRRQIMPIANQYSIEEILEGCKYYFTTTGRRITFEYSLIDGVNDQEEHAHELGKKIKALNCHVNLIPVNPIKERKYKHSTSNQITQFKNILEKYGINVTIRREMGADIDAACGQLRKRYVDQTTKQR
ncbi:MAG: 23S rRNA (adenine(2503)-C(2))-methyltransferase RlmN [Clostridiales bacterium]|nr:23S rRNA (adenine(2503)-C(2))-methyltransferase RlmN [Clostridiales bacterium]